jgi:hypothetical protein
VKLNFEQKMRELKAKQGNISISIILSLSFSFSEPVIKVPEVKTISSIYIRAFPLEIIDLI